MSVHVGPVALKGMAGNYTPFCVIFVMVKCHIVPHITSHAKLLLKQWRESDKSCVVISVSCTPYKYLDIEQS